MATGNRVQLIFAGDDKSLQQTFSNVGAGAKGMADDVGKASRDMVDSSSKASTDIAGAVDASEGKFRGLGDVIGGTGDVMEGFRTGNIAQMAMGMADLAGGMTQLVIPALTALKGFLLTGLAPAFTLIAAHPLIAGILIGGAIIAGLVILEKKFGLVSTAVEGLGDIFASIWPGIKAVINGILGGLEFIGNAAIDVVAAPIGLLNKIPGVSSIVPNVPHIKLPRLHTGGVFPGVGGREGLALLQAGEMITPRGQNGGGGITINVAGSVITERDLGRIVADALRNNRLIGVTA